MRLIGLAAIPLLAAAPAAAQPRDAAEQRYDGRIADLMIRLEGDRVVVKTRPAARGRGQRTRMIGDVMMPRLAAASGEHGLVASDSGGARCG